MFKPGTWTLENAQHFFAPPGWININEASKFPPEKLQKFKQAVQQAMLMEKQLAAREAHRQKSKVLNSKPPASCGEYKLGQKRPHDDGHDGQGGCGPLPQQLGHIRT